MAYKEYKLWEKYEKGKYIRFLANPLKLGVNVTFWD